MANSKSGAYGLGTISSQNINSFGGSINGYFLRSYQWSEIEPRKGQYTFTVLDNAIDDCIDADIYMGLMIAVGPSCPAWLYTSGVPKVQVRGQNSNQASYYPYYFDADYQRYAEAMWTAVANHISNWSSQRKAHLAWWMSAEGSSGDAGPYHGDPVDNSYNISTPEWNTEKHRIWTLLSGLIDGNTNLLLNTENDYVNYDWVRQHLPDAWIKEGNLGHDLNYTGERVTHDLEPDTKPISRTESEGIPNFNNQIHGALIFSSLSNRLDIFCINPNNGNNVLLDKFSQFASSSTSVCCYLRDTIDFTDTERFPENVYGVLIDPSGTRTQAYNNAVQNRRTQNAASPAYVSWSIAGLQESYINPKRVTNIINKMAPQGAKRNVGSYMENDYGYYLAPSNWAKGLKQADPWNSQGGWRIGSQNELYGRFARTWGKTQTAMYFKINNQYDPGTDITVKISYFDSGSKTDTWALSFNATGSRTTKITNTKTWKTVEFDISGFNRAALSGSNSIALKKTGGNIWFGLIEIVPQGE